jgi:excisionase family DNA binding protein
MLTKTKHSDPASGKQLATFEPLVKTEDVARALAVTPRYVGILCAEGRIPFHKFGRRCVRFNLARVLEAMGVETEAAVAGNAR